MAETYWTFKEKIMEFLQRYRRPSILQIATSGLYDLYPDRELSKNASEAPIDFRWPDDYYPNAALPGVYAMFGEELKLLYVGKASGNSSVGNRLGSYFTYSENKECNFCHSSWKPRFIATATIDREFRFEAPSLEEYLIRELSPRWNTQGKAPD